MPCCLAMNESMNEDIHALLQRNCVMHYQVYPGLQKAFNQFGGYFEELKYFRIARWTPAGFNKFQAV